jgi:hypothetical protein
MYQCNLLTFLGGVEASSEYYLLDNGMDFAGKESFKLLGYTTFTIYTLFTST